MVSDASEYPFGNCFNLIFIVDSYSTHRYRTFETSGKTQTITCRECDDGGGAGGSVDDDDCVRSSRADG